MKFDMDELNPGTWFLLDENNPGEGRICLRICNGDVLEKIARDTVKVSYEYHKGERYKNEEADRAKRDKLMWDYVIVDWENLLDTEGQPIACTAENKSALMAGSPVFADIVADCIDKLSEGQKKQREQAEKN